MVLHFIDVLKNEQQQDFFPAKSHRMKKNEENKMKKKQTFIVSTFILLVGGFLTKILGMFIKIIMSRLMGSEGIGLYMLILPTFSLFIGLAQFGLPVAFSKLIAEEKKNNKKLLFSLLPISFIINVIICLTVILITPILANHLLQEPRSFYPLLAMAVVLPLTSLSSLLRSYFFGRSQMLPHVVSNVLEDIIRLITIYIGVPFFMKQGISIAVTFVVLSNVLSEGMSILVLFFFLPRKITFQKTDFKQSKIYQKEALQIGIPTTMGRLTGSIGYFLEPIILTFSLKLVGYSSSFIVNQYGILSGFVLPLLLLPSFFTLAISQALLPVISHATAQGKKDLAKKKVKQAIFFSLFIGVPATILFLFIPQVFLELFYHTSQGISYMRFLAPVCLLQYIQAPLSSALDAMGKSKENFKATLLGTMIRTSCLFIFSLCKIGLWGLIFATSINVIFTTIYNAFQVKRALTN